MKDCEPHTKISVIRWQAIRLGSRPLDLIQTVFGNSGIHPTIPEVDSVMPLLPLLDP